MPQPPLEDLFSRHCPSRPSATSCCWVRRHRAWARPRCQCRRRHPPSPRRGRPRRSCRRVRRRRYDLLTWPLTCRATVGAGTTQVVHVGAGEQAVDGARSCEIAPDSDLARSGGWQSRQADGWRAVRAGLVFAGRGGRAGRRRLGRSADGACRRIGPHAGVQWLWWCKIAKARPARSGGGKAHSAHITRGCRAGAARVRARAVAVVHASSCSYYCQPWAGIRLSWVLCNHAWVETGVRGEDGKRVAGRDAAFL